ncbi:serine hydrolase [Lacticaseibacillus pabuli]|uniref:Serine hydrolase n=1 Tax=Lacticaseibacillus pabuli TaxID=3025672 RepID=A0ABY7WNJ4_9LACO|nr:serine hydrolase domain-containing protein [Lacticaseibacillus sp. KACC 23028]WDF81777.1 serine hydrolase [Lacticaseibacillus sp. KACC 23028]
MNQNLQRIYSEFDKKAHHMVSAGVTPGVTYALIDGKDVFTKRFGDEQAVPTHERLRPHQFWDMASLTKVLGTTPVFLEALNAGKLALDEPLVDVLPEFSEPSVTFQQLMTHTSKLDGYIPHRNALPADQLKHALITQLHINPKQGPGYVYRDVNFLLVGWALERIYGASIQSLMTKMAIDPFGMRDEATFHPDPAQTVPTTYTAEAGLRRGLVHDPKAAVLGEHAASAGMFATLAGLVRYVQVANGTYAQSVLPANWTRDLQHDFGGGRSLGFKLEYGPFGRTWLTHTGYTGGFLGFNPETQQGMVFLSSRCHPHVHPEFLDLRSDLIQTYLNLADTHESAE